MTSANPWQARVDAGDWAAITAELDEYGGALLPRLLLLDGIIAGHRILSDTYRALGAIPALSVERAGTAERRADFAGGTEQLVRSV